MSMWAITSIELAPEGKECEAPGCLQVATQKVSGARVVFVCRDHVLAAAEDDYRRQWLIHRWEREH